MRLQNLSGRRLGLGGLLLLTLFGGCLEFLDSRTHLAGDPATDGMIVVTAAHMKWTHDRLLVTDKVHWLGFVECYLKPENGGPVLVREPEWKEKSTRSFVFSDIPPGKYSVQTLVAEQAIREDQYELHTCTFPEVQFPELAVEVKAGEVAFVGNIYLEVKHTGWGDYKVGRHDEGTTFTMDWDSEVKLLKPIAKSIHPDSPWRARLQEHINTIDGLGR